AFLMDRIAGRRVVTRRGEFDGPPFRQGHHGLYESFTEGLCADDESAVMVLERTCDDLRCRCRTTVHQDDDGCAVQYISAARPLREPGLRRAAIGGYDDSRVEKQVRYIDCRL